MRAGLDVKVLGTGRLKRKLNVEAHAFSNSAREAIEKAGGSVKVLGEPKPPSPRRPHGPRAASKQAQPTKSESPEAQ